MDPITVPLLRLQSTQLAEGKQHLFVDNYDIESALDLAETPEQVVLSSYTGRNYLLWHFAEEGAVTTPNEASITFTVLPKIRYPGGVTFGLTASGYPRAWEYGPKIMIQQDRNQSASLAFWDSQSQEEGDWQTVPGFELKLAVTYRAVIRLNNDQENTWSVLLYDKHGGLLASKDSIPNQKKWLERFDCIFLQAAQDPMIIKQIALLNSGELMAQSDFTQESVFHQDVGLSKHPGWSSNTDKFDFSVGDTKAILEEHLSTKPETLLFLSRDHYDAEDPGVEGVLMFPAVQPDLKNYRLHLRMVTPDGTVIASQDDLAVPANKLGFYWEIPQTAQGQSINLELAFANQKTGKVDTTNAQFQVADPVSVARQGRVAINLPGSEALAGAIIPQTVGIPFPKGALQETSKLRLLDDSGVELEAAFQVDGHWSQHGSIRWIKCFFSAPVPQEDKSLVLEFGQVGQAPIELKQENGDWSGSFTGDYVKLSDGILSVRNEPSGDYTPMLKSSALAGAYIVDGNGQLFTSNTPGTLAVERSNAEQVVLRHRGWYQDNQDARFCQFDNRITLFRSAPYVRVENAWVFTGDGNQDTIREMGWRFDAIPTIESSSFYRGQGQGGWATGESLLQYAPGQAALREKGGERELGQAMPGVLRADLARGSKNITLGVKDFWENFPGEIIVSSDSLSVLTWPRHGRSNTEEVTVNNSYKLPFIHSGDELNFRLPDAYLEKPIYHGSEKHYKEGDAESANAQGVAKTTEMWLYFGEDKEDSGALLEAINERQLSAFVDSVWLADSGAFYEILAKDSEQFPEDEATYEAVALAPDRWAERMNVYGKWIWGGVLSTPDLPNQIVRGNFRTFRKAHQGWPYSWLPYARSGDVRYRNFAEASTRHMADVGFCHYSDEHMPRPLGFWNRSLIPWTFVYGPTSRHYADKVDYLWHAWHLADDYRAKETALEWEQATKSDQMDIYPWSGGRRSVNMLKTYVETFQESGDPWFIPAYREVAALHKAQNWTHDVPLEEWTLEKASFWSTGPREYLRYTGDDNYRHLYENYADYWGSEKNENVWVYYGYLPLEPLSGAWHLSNNPYYAKRIRGLLDWANVSIYGGKEDWLQGFAPYAKQGSESAVMFAGYFLSQYPFAAKVLAETQVEDGIPGNSYVLPGDIFKGMAKGEYLLEYPTVYFQKKSDALKVDLRLLYASAAELAQPWHYKIQASDEGFKLNGDWKAKMSGDIFTLGIPENAPSGEYTATISHTFTDPGRYQWGTGPALMMPLTTVDTPEVIAWPRGKDLPAISVVSQVWFKWPKNEDSLKLRFNFVPYFNTMLNPKVLNSEGETVWQNSSVSSQKTKGFSITCELQRKDFGSDGMVHVSFPGAGISWSVEGDGMLYYSLSPERWFQPKTN